LLQVLAGFCKLKSCYMITCVGVLAWAVQHTAVPAYHITCHSVWSFDCLNVCYLALCGPSFRHFGHYLSSLRNLCCSVVCCNIT
jgi:hypothetical protein